MDNQFLTTPLLASSNQRKIESNKRDELIKVLQLKNSKLKGEIYKINTILQEKLSQTQEETPHKRQSIMKVDDNPQVLQQELANAYKKIKMYQYEINKIEEGHGATNLTQKASQIDNIIKEKKNLAEKLRAQVHKQQRIVNQNIKKLANNNKQQQIERQVKSMTDEIEFLKEKLRKIEQNGQMKQKNLKKQYEFVQKLESQLLQNGISHADLDDIKLRIMRKSNPNATQHADGVTNFPKNMKSTFKEKQDQQRIEDRTIDRYRVLQNEVRILQKMQGDYEKQITVLEDQKKLATEKNYQSRNKLVECENEIQTLQKQILELKGKVIPSNMKPLMPLRSLSSHIGANTKTKLNTSLVSKSTKQLSHMLKFDEVGIATDKGQRFTDRNILGKTNLNTHIIGMTAFIDKNSGVICGFHFLYSGNKHGGQYVRKDRESREKPYTETKFVCGEGDYIKSISGTLDPTDRLESLSFITKKMLTHKVGSVKTLKKSFSLEIGQEQTPVCVFGSMLVIKEAGKKQYSIIEHFGVEINKEAGVNNIGTTLQDPELE